MALQSPVRLQATNCMPTTSVLFSPTGSNAGLYRPSDRFAPPRPRRQPPRVSAAPRISMRLASKQSYICRDCGYIYSDRTPFEKLSDNYFCPVCGAPKRRFREYTPAVSKNANATDVRKARKAELQRDEAIGKALPIAIVIGAAALAALYFYLNSTF
ncbi:hypothetical protein RHSIM_Rhsim08G0198600 [Rhododendron simsii]|uniref:Rubredoxin-like domain-containing protein n=1 Tax=Rhododendron simsii TaxID=118357 RepID=A0A834GMU8_RHOSS|nr:hypothetical protein RHSIM_Rhsim08G0198600 [Rhododendron simsii]